MLQEFKKFILRGNVVDLAVAVVIGAAFGAVISSLVKNLLTPLIGIVGHHDFSALHFTIRRSVFRYGAFINDLIAFVLIGGAVFFFVVQPINTLLDRRKTEPDVESPKRDCPECLSSIPRAARRCAFCTAELTPAA